MAKLEPLQVGVMFWTGGELGFDGTPEEIVSSVASLGVKCGQLGVHGVADLGPEAQEAWKAALDKYDVTVVTAFPGFAGESYASPQICTETVGFVPAATRAEREQRTYVVSDFAKALGIPGMASHIGCLPHDRSHPDYVGVRDLMQRVCDHCAKNGQTFALETGQEPGENLLQFLRDVDRENLGINFDPANLILYGFGGHMEALELVKDKLLTVHCKDGVYPPAKGEWGKETPLGEGAVGMDKFVAKLKEIGYTGPLTIEREIVGDAQREDILGAIALLERLRAA